MLSVQELKTSSRKELIQELQNARSEIVKVRMNVKTKSIKDSSLANKQKKYIAQIETILKELDMEELVKSADTI
jgi:ribosomal protein L29